MGSSGSKNITDPSAASKDEADSGPQSSKDKKTSNAPQTTTKSLPKDAEAQQSKDKSPTASKLTAPSRDVASDIVEATVCDFDDMKDGEMKTVTVGSGKVLLVRDDGEYYSVGYKCTHYGAPLSKGVLCNGRVRCQWHGACFNVKTGDIEDFPGLDSLPKFDVEIRDKKVVVIASQKALDSNKHIKPMSCQSVENEDTYLIIGGGCSASVAAETLRQEGFTGRVVIATKEKFLPYDRTKLSKSLDASGDKFALRDEDFYSVYDIEVLTEKEATKVNTLNRSVTFKDDSSIEYDKLLIATGGRPRELSLNGDNLDGVCYLRTPDDANKIHHSSQGKNVVIIGNSFIGMEVAAYLSSKSSSVTVVGRSSVPFRLFGEKIGTALKQLFVTKGVKFIDNNEAAEFIGGEDDKLTEVVLKDGTRLPAEVCVIGAGCVPSTDFLYGSDITMTPTRHIVVDQFMQTTNDYVFAAGDIAEFPLVLFGNQKVNIGHWQVACTHGRLAALNMLGKESAIQCVPYFWSMIFGKSIRYAGYSAGFEDVIIHGELEDLKFVAFFIKNENVVAVASMNFDPIVSQAAEMFAASKTIKAQSIESDPMSFLRDL